MRTIIIDYGMGNLNSVKRAFEECGTTVVISDKPDDLASATHIVLPGVGAFADGMHNLNERGWVSAIKKIAQEKSIPLLGICLGMQLLADFGNEGGNINGLGCIPGEVKRLEPKSTEERIPHVGWNEISITKDTPLFHKISDKSDFYFVHSYHFVAVHSEHVIATTPYCGGFVSAVMSGTVYGCQFHPEKSQRLGFQLIQNFLKL